MSTALECAKEIVKQTFLTSFPLSVKMLEKEENIPREAKRPVKDFGYHLSLCQGFSISRREGPTIAMSKEDMWCPEAVWGLGFVEPPKEVLDGRQWDGVTALGQTKTKTSSFKDLAACRNYGNSLPRFKPGKYASIVFGPAMTSDFEPDLLLVYGNPAQIRRLVVGLMYNDGKPISGMFYGGACLRTVVPAIQTGKCQVTFPCVPEVDMSQDDEMMFSVPKEKMEDLTLGLRACQDKRLPTNFMLTPEYNLPLEYAHVRQIMGLG